MRFPEFEAMIGPARLYPQLWRLLLGVLVVAFCYAGGLALMAVGLFVRVGPIDFFGWLRRIAVPAEPLPALLLLATFAGMLLGPILAAGACHFRGPGTLFGPWSEFRRGLLTVLALCAPVYALWLVVGSAFSPVVDNMPWATWLRFLPWALPLILLQVSAEEVLFRGYLQQQLAARFAARWVWMLLPSALFAALHWTPTAGDAVWLIMATTYLFALIAADLTARTGSLGAAIGLHFVNNAFGILAVSISGSITGLARWTTPFALGESTGFVFSAALNLALLVVLWRLLIRLLDR